MSVVPEIPYIGDIQQRVSQQMADLQRKLAAVQASDGGLPPAYVNGTSIAANTIGANNIVAGSITSNEIAAGTIVATNIAALAITTGLLAANAVTAAKIAANTITATQIASHTITATELAATAIDGMTITGSTIQTSATANTTGAGVVITTLGISAYDATHTRQVYIDSTTGLIQARGVLLATPGSNIPTATISGLLPGGANRYSNAAFQNGAQVFDAFTGGWGYDNATVVSDGGTTVPPVYGSHTVKLVAANTIGVDFYQSAFTDSWKMRVVPGLSYTFSFYVWPDSSNTGVRQSTHVIYWYDATGTLITTVTPATSAWFSPVLGQWTRVTSTAQAPSGAAFATGVNYVAVSPVTGDTFYIACPQFEEGDRASAWAPRADEVLINQINANNINVANLAAINANLGTITAGALTAVTVSASTITGTTITTTSGGVIQTAASGDRAWMDSTGFNIASGTNTTPPNVDRISFREQSGNTQVASIYNWYVGGSSILRMGPMTAAGAIQMEAHLTHIDINMSGTGGSASYIDIGTENQATLTLYDATLLDGLGQSSFVQVAGGVASSGSGVPKAMRVNTGTGLVTVPNGANSATVTGIAHGLGVQPIGVFVNSPSQLNTFIPIFGRAANIGTTTFDVSVFSLNLATATSNQTVGYEWIAIG